jgi:hypothetical protein
LLLAAAYGQRWAFPLLILLALGEPAWYGIRYTIFGEFYRRSDKTWLPNVMPLWAELDKFEPPPTDDRSERIMGGSARDLVLAPVRGWKRLSGTDGIPPHKRLDYRSLAAIRIAQTRWVHETPSYVSFYDKQSDTDIFDTTPLIPLLKKVEGPWYEVPEVMPRARCVQRADVSDTPAEDIDNIDIETTALVTEPVALDDPGGSATAKARVTEDRPGKITVAVDSPSKQLLVLTESFFKSWVVHIDGENPQPALRVNGDFLGCVVPAGKHEVAFSFESKSVRNGRIASLAAAAIAGALVIAGFLAPRTEK